MSQDPQIPVAPQVVPPSLSTATTQVLSQQPVNPVSSPNKEAQPAVSTGEAGAERAQAQAAVEHAPSRELEPAVEEFIQEVEHSPDQLPKEIVVSGNAVTVQPQHVAAQPVIVLPITQQTYQAGKKDPVDSSRRWLSTWVDKIIAMLGGKVVFQPQEETQLKS
jgi:hypothetical protein